MQRTKPFTVLSTPCRIWAVAAVRGEAGKLRALHEVLWPRLRPGDKLVYLGNVAGSSDAVLEAIDELLRFRVGFLAIPGNCISDHAILRGRHEEMWHKLLELQFAVNPREVLDWMLTQGLAKMIEAYGGNVREGEAAARQGPVVLTKWTSGLRAAIHATPGHTEFMSALKHAAYTRDAGMIFVHAGIDPTRPLDAQGDALWWNTEAFDRMNESYFGTRRIVRGFDPEHRGIVEREFTLGIDGGCGRGGDLIAVCLPHDGSVIDSIIV